MSQIGGFYKSVPPALVNFNGMSDFVLRITINNDLYPQTHFHFLCLSYNQVLCLPVYVRCNDVNDCSYGEDEQGCDEDTVTCPEGLLPSLEF